MFDVEFVDVELDYVVLVDVVLDCVVLELVVFVPDYSLLLNGPSDSVQIII